MAVLFQGLGSLLGLVAFVCFIIVVVKMFQNGQTGLGVATIVALFCCGIGYIIALVVGWQNADKWGIRNLMMAFSVCLGVSILCTAIAYALGGTAMFLPNMPRQ